MPSAKEQWFKFLSPKGKQLARHLERTTKPIAGPPTKPVHFEDIMDRVREMGVVDFTLFREIAERFHVSLHNVYNYFYGYPMKVGVAA